jgi:hypothetical protein
MKKSKNILECTLTYGEPIGYSVDFMAKFSASKITFNYDCTQIKIPKTGTVEDKDYNRIKNPFYSNKYTYKSRKEDFFNYSLRKIYYELREVKDDNNNTTYKRIQNLKLIFTNKEGKEEVLLDTSDGKDLPEKIELLDEEVIEYVIVYLKNDLLCGLDLTTNETKIYNKSYIIGTTSGANTDNILVKDDNKIISGIGCYANENMGVTGIYFYQMDKKYLTLLGSLGLRQLRAKVKQNKEFKDNIEKNKNNLDDALKLTFDICCFPDSIFFPIISYASHI